MKSRNNIFKLCIGALLIASVFVTNFADADESPVTPKNDTNQTQVLGDFPWSSCGGFCGP